MLTSYQVAKPELNWGDDGAPVSTQFDDVYFDKASGLEETQYVFLQHNQLESRWKELSQRHFVIAETGFGTGLNFLCAWQAFIKSAPCNSQLHFISVEKYPLSKESLAAALDMWPSLQNLSQELVTNYPELCHGFHRIELAQGRIQLSLWFGEAEEGFSALNADVDAWFLDGFAPSKNPEMWTDKLFQHIRRLSHTGTTFSTFTAAGIVRRGLKEVGFDVRKVKGFGRKREMALGELNQGCLPYPQRMAQGQGWFNIRPEETPSISKVLVVGSGLAGANTAYALAQQGIQVEVWEQGQQIACAASGNPQGMLYPKLGAQDTPLNRFYLTSYLHAARLYNQLDSSHGFWGPCGLIQIPTSDKEAKRFDKILQSNLYPKKVLQVSLEKPNSLLLPLSGWVAPSKLCKTLLAHKNISVQLGTSLQSLEKVATPLNSKTKAPFWKAHSQTKEEFFSHVVLCNANDFNDLDIQNKMPTSAIRGQVAHIDKTEAEGVCRDKGISNTSLDIKKVLCDFGYVSPPLQNTIHFGSTYDLKDPCTEVRQEGHERNLKILENLLSLPSNTLSTVKCQGRVSFRCASPDYTPIVGPLQSTDTLKLEYGNLAKNAKWQSDEVSEPLQNIFINIAHGSRGLVSTPLSGAYIASLITNTPSPLEQEVAYKLHPSRFVVKQIKRGV
ncbi:bifunctional tRNA (5-methylaminomethyl-2-thiouridine)(34)-methyltransferase MnmD/FAD-dependent 5-carboxymethylaminomethyl-2-thiouridine(34) oxidoreductase MnmC [Marinomonas sp. C2222]|uniref:tRNA 5-methylaminomethyl-2-thiouridine biosynthesis bifunctional protein MnmC n=1 Tax=Marinomonas sargassi TaxID=2984494 RepID=A0ABT2YN85_9GAMM|nr:bifunctional tRNA (5-methylaminomethyl-2-thiouridine)(34)-methyltransferase MnmD/FAD-dependent 5-carboxymethylaminomethyl-2-thiouridine(34) oxidoreductase MnmC [Marinomonas sargassi]MCV2401351.1 bifunctional tRNA (5-methylaminomethyl-2-thiouridine)(34)-methyltransferase MnmD/FAD-dependent 5-carboxymethylaminomethyl-2-thiouridine(34) oxidoreductase MnmC [Marinomonas sargassi]